MKALNVYVAYPYQIFIRRTKARTNGRFTQRGEDIAPRFGHYLIVPVVRLSNDALLSISVRGSFDSQNLGRVCTQGCMVNRVQIQIGRERASEDGKRVCARTLFESPHYSRYVCPGTFTSWLINRGKCAQLLTRPAPRRPRNRKILLRRDGSRQSRGR